MKKKVLTNKRKSKQKKHPCVLPSPEQTNDWKLIFSSEDCLKPVLELALNDKKDGTLQRTLFLVIIQMLLDDFRHGKVIMKSGGVNTIFTIAKRDIRNGALQGIIMGILKLMLFGKGNAIDCGIAQHIVEEGGIALVSFSMSTNNNMLLLQNSAISLIFRLLCITEGDLQKVISFQIVSNDVHKKIVNAMKYFPEDNMLQETSLVTLHTLLLLERNTAFRGIYKAGGIQTVIIAMSNFHSDIRILRNAIWLLAACTKEDICGDMFTDVLYGIESHNGVQELARAFNDYYEDMDITKPSLALLCKFLFTTTYEAQLTNIAILAEMEDFQSALQHFSDSLAEAERSKIDAQLVVAKLSVYHKEKAAGVPAIVYAINSLSPDDPLFETAVIVMIDMAEGYQPCESSPENIIVPILTELTYPKMRAIAEHGKIELIFRGLRNCTTEKGIEAIGCKVLAEVADEHEQRFSQVVSLGGVDLALALLEKYDSDNLDVQEEASKLLSCLLANEKVKEACLLKEDKSILHKMIDKFNKLEKHEAIRKIFLSILARLTYESKYDMSAID